jgi:PAS domain S-box-containing protein
VRGVEGTVDRSDDKQDRLPPHWLRLLLDNISDSVIVTDRNGHIQYWNSGAEKIFQHSTAEAIGRHINLIYVPSEGEELQEAQILALDGEIISDVEALVKSRDGKIRTLLLSIVPVLGDSGEVEYLASIGKDITIVRGLEEKVLAAEKLETVKEMIITLNHKMNQPLAVASLYLGMLQETENPVSAEERADFLRLIEEQLDRVADLLRKIAEMEEIRTVAYLAENKMVDVDGGDN